MTSIETPAETIDAQNEAQAIRSELLQQIQHSGKYPALTLTDTRRLLRFKRITR